MQKGRSRGRPFALDFVIDRANRRQPIARERSALARLEARIGLVDHENLAAATDDLAVAVTGLRRLERGENLHGTTFLMGAGRPEMAT
jgi:hypothetical protein